MNGASLRLFSIDADSGEGRQRLAVGGATNTSTLDLRSL